MIIAHISDLHLLALDGAIPLRLFNKRITGYVNIRLHRGAVHKPFALTAAAAEFPGLNVDHLVITGDFTNLALEREFALGLRFLEHELGWSPDRVSLVPGNHDAYTAGAHKTRRFATTFERYLGSDLPQFRMAGEVFPFVHLRGPAAIIGLSTAVPSPPLMAAGEIGRAQRDKLAQILAHPDVRDRTPVILQHHPLHPPANLAKRLMSGLRDAKEEAELLARSGCQGLLLHGHLHKRIRRSHATIAGDIHAVGAPSATLLYGGDERMAGFNLYEIDDGDGAIRTIESHRLDDKHERFLGVAIPHA